MKNKKAIKTVKGKSMTAIKAFEKEVRTVVNKSGIDAEDIKALLNKDIEPRGKKSKAGEASMAGAATRKRLRVASDCTGWDTVSVALEGLSVEHENVFACDIDPKVREVLKANYDYGHIYEDVTNRDHDEAGPSDVYSAGFPCQAFSP